MAGNSVTLTFAGDSQSLERTFSKVGSGAKGMASDLDKAKGDVKSFGGAVDGMNDKVDASESKFMGAADLLDGLGGAFGLPTEGITNMARSFGDLAGGFTSVIGPAIAKIAGMLGIQTAATAAQTTATGAAATAQGGLNAALLANPIGLVIAGIVGLVAIFVLAWKHSETFRDVVRGALNVVKSAAEGLLNFFKDLPGQIANAGKTLVNIITWPYKTAFNAIATLWNNTVGKLAFSVPDWVPGIGGKGFSMPNLPTFHNGGIVPGNPGVPVPVMALGGERISRAADNGGSGSTVVQLVVDGRVLAETVAKNQRQNVARGFAA